MNKFEKYPAYKDSGVEWLGEIPAGWEVKRVKFLLKLINDKSSAKDSELQYVGMENIESQTGRYIQGENEADGLANSFQVNDILFGKLRPYLAKVHLTKFNGICSSEFLVYRTEIPGYFQKVLVSATFINLVDSSTYGAKMPRASSDWIGNQLIPLPPLPEQTAIAVFLDEKTAKIDTAIKQKEQMIALLKERKQILIQNAVTKGINPAATMKNSGVEWIGEIPEGWEVKRLKHLYSSSFGGGTPSTDKEHFWNGGIPWISSADVKFTMITRTLRNISLEGLSRSSANLAPSGSIIMVTRSGILQHTLPIAIISMDMAINQDIKCFLLRKDLLPEYLLCFINGKNKEVLVETRQQGATVESINMEQFANLQIPIPPIPEQIAIVAFITTHSAKIDTSISLQQQQITRLKEYKATLIDSAVTGKIMVC